MALSIGIPVTIVMARSLVALAAAALGGLLATSPRLGHRALCGMVSFAGGTLLSVAIFAVMPETAEMVGWSRVPLFVTLGVLVLYTVNKRMGTHCPAEHASALQPDHGYIAMSSLLVVAVGVHSFMDGFSIAIAAHTSSLAFGWLVLAAVAFHKVPEGMALVSVGRQAGMGPSRALLVAVLVESTTLFGSALGILIGPVSRLAVGAALGFVAGSFLFVGGYALVEEARDHEWRSVVGWAIVGMALMFILARTLGFE